MKLPGLFMIALFTLAGGATAQNETFEKARAAYDDGRYADAATAYENMIENGVVNAEVHYNLANAFFKDNDLPNAVWHYRVAWMEAPRDPDIQANFQFALNAAGAKPPDPEYLERVFSLLSRTEWILFGAVAHAALCLLLILAIVAKPIRRPALKACLIPAAAIAIAVAGWWRWKQLDLNPEWVVVRTEATALYGPVEGSTAHFKLPLGALARQTASDPKGWIELEYDGKSGWVRSDHIKRVSP